VPSPDPAVRLEAPAGPWRGPVPVADIDSAPFWAGLRRHELLILRCAGCRTWVHPPQASCPRCLSLDVRAETPGDGRGTVYSFTVANREFAPGVPPPYVAALVDLDEGDGVRLVTNLVNVAVGDVRIGMPVRPVFVDLELDLDGDGDGDDAGATLVYFEPAG